ncbi:MAG: hypothetical protein JXA67_20515 [Micromonosporaceae bacterium]|nr:hypothetical protein [Micromonosporaceae bacterium]
MTLSYSMTWNGDTIAEALREAAARGTVLAAEHLLQVSRTLCPHEEGMLEDTSEVTSDPDKLQACVSYTQPYAVRQHEELDWHHDKDRQAKYLEQPANTERDTMQEKIAKQIRQALQ